MTLQNALDRIASYFDFGEFLTDLSRRVAFRTESRNRARAADLRAYLSDELGASLTALGVDSQVIDNPIAGAAPMLIGARIEDERLPTVLLYGHGDVVDGNEHAWSNGRSPWQVSVEGDRWYGRGTADNKGQHSVNLAALDAVLQTRGRLGFNLRCIFEMGEETGSPGLDEVCQAYAQQLQADLLIASDGPRQNADAPTIFLGSRGALHFRLRVRSGFGAMHSGNWGGALANPAVVLVNALASLVDGGGRIRINGLLPPPIPPSVRALVATLSVGTDVGDPALSKNWGEPGLSAAERIYAWNTLEILAMQAGLVSAPVSAIPASAEAVCQLRFVPGTDWLSADSLLRAHLDRQGFNMVEVIIEESGAATRLDPNDAWVGWARDSIRRTTGKPVVVLPNLGGTIPNSCFAQTLGLPTIWIPHSYPNCRQHAPDEHLLASVSREALQLMTGVFWDLGESGKRVLQQRR